jgi:polyisoprenoid-binding protein YceI
MFLAEGDIQNMSKKILIGISVIAILVIVGAVAYVLRPTAEASAPIEAISVVEQEPAAEDLNSETQENSPANVAEEMPVEQEKTEPQAEMPATEQPASEVEPSTSDGVIIFSIIQAESEVRVTLGELLSGVPTTVIGATDQVAGEIAIDPADPASATVGVILVNARTLATDNDFRNRAINNSILETGKYEFITFTPTEVINFPENPTLGEALEFQISGDLTVRDSTHPVIFDVIVTAVSETRLEGSASAMIARADYGLQIPEVPRVADVDEEVLLEIDFVAVAK